MHPNLENLARVHEHLQRLGLDVVFVGGATIGLYLDEFGSSRARPTKDVDCIVAIEARPDYLAFESMLRDAGIFPSAEDGDPLCRWKIAGVKVDIMPFDETILGFTSRFYRLGFETAQVVELPSGARVKVLSPALLLATKIDAYLDRGIKDPMASEDLEDIISLLDGCVGIAKQVTGAAPKVRAVVKEWASDFLTRRDALDLVEGHIGAWGAHRVGHVVELLDQLAALPN